MKPLHACRLYGFVDTAYLRGRPPAAIASALCEGGADLVQLRAKQSSPQQILQMAREIKPVLDSAGVGFVVNDHLEVALQAGADICHLGQEDFFDAGFKHVRDLPVAPGAIRIGLSTHAPAQAQRAVAAGADYVAIGPVYPTGTKPSAKPVTLDYVRWAAEHLRVPWFAIGGINHGTIADVLDSGATRVCIVSAILNSDDVAAECRKFRERLT